MSGEKSGAVHSRSASLTLKIPPKIKVIVKGATVQGSDK